MWNSAAAPRQRTPATSRAVRVRRSLALALPCHFPAAVAEIFERAEDSRAEEIRSIDSWTHDEAAKLLEIVRAKQPRWYPLVLTLLHTGCRRGEALGMQWPHVDFRRKRITIRRARVNSRTVLPKHRRRRDKPRTLVITPAMEDALRGLQTFRYRHSSGWVFASRNVSPATFEETAMTREARAA